MARVIGNRMARLFRPSLVYQLSVRGRRTGRWRSAAVVVLEHEGERYLLAPAGNTEWSRNLRAAGTGRLKRRGQVEQFAVVEVPPQERAPLVEAYLHRFRTMPTVAAAFRALPDAADHPAFRIVNSRELT
jgi:deazaflavin-dependent oxidoreductase (nitroreductase family)